MDVSNQERAVKKKLQNFLQELQHFGTLRGFRHFQCYVRSKEELVITVNNTLHENSLSYSGSLSTAEYRKPSSPPSDSLLASCLPYENHHLVVSQNTQASLSGMRENRVGLPPALETECMQDDDVTLFLIAGYARYSCPYVWVSSNHERFLKLSGDEKNDTGSPLKLKSTARWKDGDVQVTDIIEEVVRLCTYPSPWNPFEIDLKYFQSLTQPDKFFCSAAMLSCLQKIVIHTLDSKPYLPKVFENLQNIAKFHFASLSEMATAENIPIVTCNSCQHQENQDQQRKQDHHEQRYQHNKMQSQHQQQNEQQSHHQQQNEQQSHHQQQNEQQSQHQQRHVYCLQSRYPKVPIPTNMSPLQPPLTVNPTVPLNTSGRMYGQRFEGTFPGGFNRMPAPSII